MRTLDSVSPPTASRVLLLAFSVGVVVLAALITAPAPAAAAGTPPWFGPNVKVNAPPAYLGGLASIAVGSDGVAYLGFSGWGGSSTGYDIFFAKSTDGARTWTAAIKVNNDVGGAAQLDPSLALDHLNNIYIAWMDQRPTSGSPPDVYFAKSSDGGLSFGPNVRVNDVPANSQSEPSVGIDAAGIVYVAWTDTRNSFTTGPDIYIANSTDLGLSFNPSVRVNTDAAGAEQSDPTIAVAADRTVYAAWEDPRNGVRGRDIHFSRSKDLGNTWDPSLIVNDDAAGATQAEPTIAVNGTGAIFLAWTDYRTSNTAPDIYAARSTNSGSSFTANVKVNEDNGAAIQALPSIAVRPGRVIATWTDGRTYGGSSLDIYWSASPDGLTSWTPSQRVNDDTTATIQAYSTVAFDPAGDAFAAWVDGRSSGQDVYAATLDVVSPVADSGGDLTVGQGTTASFDGSSSLDNLGIATYAWDFGDGATATGASASHPYPTPGTYTATLTVWDYSGNANSDSLVVTVRDTEAPVIRGAGDRAVDEGVPLFFDASASTDNVGVVSWSWDFGDNTTATGPTATHVYATPGTYTATVTLRDAADNTATTTMAVTVRTVAPKSAELLGMIQVLELIVVILAVLLAIVGYMAYTLWRRSRGGPGTMYTPPADPPGGHDPLDMPPPPAEPPRDT